MIDYHLPLLNTSEAVLVMSEDLRLEFANPAALRMMGFEGATPTDMSLRHMLDDRSAALAATIESHLVVQGHWNGDIWLRRTDAGSLPVRLVVDRYHDANGYRHACVMSDISQRKQTEARLIELSQLDSLTGLFNRSHFMQQLDAHLNLLCHEELQYALLFVDVDDLKHINDTLGHHIGDLCLCEVARRLGVAVRHSQHAGNHPTASEPLVARIGGDEFVILLSIAECDQARRIATSISELMNVPWQPDERHQLVISTSIGIAYAPLHGRSSKTLLQLADRAMYHAKNSRKGSVHEFIQQHPQVPLRFDTGFDVLPSED
jgi:diguanylate cyclase (GGDEF)-like protein/PAS domain S-box-containing protein